MSDLQNAKEEYERDFDPLSGGLYIGELEKAIEEYEEALIEYYKMLRGDYIYDAMVQSMKRVIEKSTGQKIEELIK